MPYHLSKQPCPTGPPRPVRSLRAILADAVWGALYRISADDLAALDRYEQFDTAGPPALNAYDRRRIEVTLANGTIHRGVWCYFVHQPHGHVAPSTAYRTALLEGAAERALPADYVLSMHRAFDGAPSS